VAEKYSLQLEGPTISESVPGTALVIRPATVTLQGRVSDLTLALNHLQSDQPLIAITQLALRAATATSVEMHMEFTTVWK